VLCLISGGGSALLSCPRRADAGRQAGHQQGAAGKSGAAIDEMNCVRKHLSAIKGGRLAALCAPARVVTLLISDVPGDDPRSSPAAPPCPTPAPAPTRWPSAALRHRPCPRRGAAGLESGAFETPKPGDACFAGHQVHLIATPQHSLEAAAALARAPAWRPTS
jgi:glycerate 2-kinase